jgi:hypothetical protein
MDPQSATSIAAALARIEQKVDGLDTRLFNGGTGVISTIKEDIKNLEARMDNKDKWDRIRNLVMFIGGPFVAAAHAIANHFGAKV